MPLHKSASFRRRKRLPSQRLARRGTTTLPVAKETSAGGLVIKVENRRALVAVIARRNRAGVKEWCLPKGHLEWGETPAEAARREIFEETGIWGKVVAPLTTIEYWFSGAGRQVHKTVHHFLLEEVSGTIGVENDPDHEAEEAAWIPIEQVRSALVYPNERRVVSVAMDLLGITG